MKCSHVERQRADKNGTNIVLCTSIIHLFGETMGERNAADGQSERKRGKSRLLIVINCK